MNFTSIERGLTVLALTVVAQSVQGCTIENAFPTENTLAKNTQAEIIDVRSICGENYVVTTKNSQGKSKVTEYPPQPENNCGFKATVSQDTKSATVFNAGVKTKGIGWGMANQTGTLEFRVNNRITTPLKSDGAMRAIKTPETGKSRIEMDVNFLTLEQQKINNFGLPQMGFWNQKTLEK